MSDTLLSTARQSVDYLLEEHPVFSRHKDDISIVITGSLAGGFADKFSDIDLWVLCSDEASSDIAEEFAENGLRFEAPPPNKTVFEDTDIHYFAFPLSKMRQGLEMYDDMTLYFAAKSIVCHDAESRYRLMIEPYIILPSDVLASKVRESYGWVISLLSGLEIILRRYQPVLWIETMGYILTRTLNLCCWLDGKAPGTPKWLIQQAESCSTANIMLPPLKEMMKEFNQALMQESPQASDDSPVIRAADALRSAARQAVDSSGYADIPTPIPVIPEWM